MDTVRLGDAFREYSPTAVVHFAAYTDVGESVAQPLKYYRNNVVGTLNLLEVMRKYGVKQMVFSSTCATYGVPDVIPISETHPQRPINPYGISKLMNEQMLASVDAAHGIRSISLRYFNAGGADPEGQIGEERHSETHLIPLVLQVAAGRRSHISIHGTDYETPDGTCMRDYVHVSDLAAAHVLALKALEARGSSATYNLGTGHSSSVREVIRTAETVTRRKIGFTEGPRRGGDAPKLLADARRAKIELGWKPQYGNLEHVIATAWNWMLKRNHEIAGP
jgi:UDP-glucose-4-epimerase GalE